MGKSIQMQDTDGNVFPICAEDLSRAEWNVRRFSDGVLMQWRTAQFTPSSQLARFSFGYQGYIEAPVGFVSVRQEGHGDIYAGYTSVTVNGIDFYLYNYSNSSTVTCTMLAVGRWK